jgi:glycosyltransferase involved in cell wall biosynthesis
VKNHAVLIDAFSLLVPERPDAFLVIVGDGPLRSQLERQIERLNLQQHVRITGVLPDPAPILRQLDVFALSSEIEGTSMSILEAMATGLPIVATAVGGTPRLLRDGACGVLTPPGDAGAFGRALLDVLADQDAARHRGIQARETVRAEHSLEHMADQYETIYAGHEFSAQRPAMTRRS